VQIPEGFTDLFDDAVVGFLVVATLSTPDKAAVAPVWFVSDDRGLVFTSDDDSVKARNVRRQPNVAAVVLEEGEHARYVSVRGAVEELHAGVDDVAGLYRRIVRRYEHREPTEPDPDGTAYFRLVPDRMNGYDYRDYQA
jgi:nitroimidazol reductase NimA-like FMN-containing flavoprotein (pyridoxamine 5'-phosphate oxidase superfamily)